MQRFWDSDSPTQPTSPTLNIALFPTITFLQELQRSRQAWVSPQVPFCRPAVRTGAAHVQSLSLHGAAARRPPYEVIDALPAIRTLRSTLPCLIEVTQIKAAAHPAKQTWLIKQNILHVLTKTPCIQPTDPLIWFICCPLCSSAVISAPSHLCRCTRFSSLLFNDLFYSKTHTSYTFSEWCGISIGCYPYIVMFNSFVFPPIWFFLSRILMFCLFLVMAEKNAHFSCSITVEESPSCAKASSILSNVVNVQYIQYYLVFQQCCKLLNWSISLHIK